MDIVQNIFLCAGGDMLPLIIWYEKCTSCKTVHQMKFFLAI